MSTNNSTVSTNTINIYFLAAPEDEQQCKAVKKYLGPVIRNSKRPIEIHSDFEIPPGQDVKEYKQKLFEADIVLAFISSDFINDDDTYLRTQRVIERYNRNETVMLPILVRNCMWKSTPFVNLPLLPKNIQPLNNKQFWNSEDDALTAVVTDIYESIENFSYENNGEVDIAEAKVSELLTETQIDRTPPEIETVEPIIKSETPIVEATEETITPVLETTEQITEKEALVVDEIEEHEKAPEIIETKKTEPPKIKKKPTNINNVAMDVDWRKSYYKNVLLKRAVAFVLDIIITFLPAYLFSLILFFILDLIITNPDINAEMSDDKFLLSIIFVFISYFIICAVFESSKYKGTFGKIITKLEITDRDGQRVSFIKAFFRNIFRMITAISYIVIIPFIIQIFTFVKTKKFFHDQLSYTVVGEKMKR